MADLLQIFSGNPLSTFVGKKIEAATRPDLESEDWGLNMEICDIINDNDDDAKDAVRAIKKRLQQIEQDRNFTITDRTLTILETCVSNCSHRFHLLVMTKDFIQDLVKLIGPKNNPPIDLQERVLSLIERWAEAFKTQPDLNGVVVVYNDLKAKGVTFPARNPTVPIQTPQRSVPTATTTSASLDPRSIAQNPMQTTPASVDLQPSEPTLPSQPIGQVLLQGEGYNKITQDLSVVESSIEMFNDVMRVLGSPHSEEADWTLSADLNSTCHKMKDRIVHLIEHVGNEDLTMELLRLNDELNTIFTRYDRLVKNKSQTLAGESLQRNETQKPAGSPSKPSGVSSRTLNDLSLIDFDAMKNSGDSNPQVVIPNASTSLSQSSTSKTSVSGLTNPTTSDPFDTSNVRIPTTTTSQHNQISDSFGRLNLETTNQNETAGDPGSGSKRSSGLPEEVSSVREQDFVEIENWLKTDAGKESSSLISDVQTTEPISIPNSEFDNFIASRALAGSNANGNNNHVDRAKSDTKQHQAEPSV